MIVYINYTYNTNNYTNIIIIMIIIIINQLIYYSACQRRDIEPMNISWTE
jgi:hypothetical protein